MKTISKLIFISLLLFLFGCDKKIEDGVRESDLSKDVEMITDFGTIILRLSDETPKHRNNFIKLVNEKYYDSIAFHRVMDNFVIQAGNPTSKPNKTYNVNGDPSISYTLDSEFRPNLFHKRGALGAARNPDLMNPTRASSGFQFYIVQNGKQNDSALNQAVSRINLLLAKNNVINRPEFKSDLDAYIKIMTELEKINASNQEISKEKEEEIETNLSTAKNKLDSYKFDSLAKLEIESMKKYSFPKAHSDLYKSSGGLPRLDQNYTVFGEVVKGMHVVDSIAGVTTNKRGKPINDVRIISAKMVNRKSYK